MRGIALPPVMVIRPSPLRLGAALLIFGAAFAGAAALHSHVFVAPLGGWDLGYKAVHPWWVSAATLALCVLGVAGAASVLRTAPRAAAIGHTVASVLFLSAGIAAIADAGVVVTNNAGLLGRTNLAIVLLLLGLTVAALARTFWSRLPR